MKAIAASLVILSGTITASAGASAEAIRGIVVNAEGKPVPHARVWVRKYGLAIEGRSDAEGKFSIEFSGENPAGSLVIASNQNGLLGVAKIPHDIEVINEQRVELKPARLVDVNVVNGDGHAVSDAAVFVQSDYVTVATGKTNADGQLALAVPQGRQLQYVFVDAGNRGIDYAVFRTPTSPKDNPFSLPHDHREPITLTLAETRSVTVKAVDQDGNPIADAIVSPWLYSLPKRGGRANLGSFVRKQTDANGIVSYDNIPIENEHDVTIWVRKDGYQPEDRFTFDPKSDEQQLTARLLSLVSVRGRIVHQNGRPAAGVNVMVSGDGHGFASSFRSQATTTNDGSFELDVAPNKYYAFVAREKHWASQLETRVVLDSPVSGIELTLQQATRVFGRVVVGDTDEPVSGEYVQLYQRPAGNGYYELPSDQRLPNPEDSRNAISPMIVVGGKTDDDGRFEYFVGPGTFYAFGPRESQRDVFEIIDQREFEILLKAKPKLDGKLVGRVVRKDDPNKGVAEIKVFGKYLRPLAITDKTGNFEVKRFGEDVLCGAFTDDYKLGTLKDVEAGARRVQFELAPTAVLRGTLLDEESGMPAANEEISASIRVTHEGGTFSSRFRRSDTTASDGTFEISGVVPGHLYTFNVVRERGSRGSPRSWSTVGEFTASEAAAIDVGELRLPAPYRPPTTEDRIARAFQGQDDLAKRLTQRLADAELAYQQVLLVVADQEAESTRQFFEARYDYAKLNLPLRKALANYIVVGVDADQTEFLSQQGVTAPLDGGVTFAILNSYGSIVVQTRVDELSAAGKLDRERLTEFLITRRVPLPDARRELAAARETARRGGKRVLVQVSGPGCAPCVLLSRYLDSRKALISKDYVYLKLDSRMPHGEEVINELRPGDDRGIPWMVIMSAEGTKLVTSDSAEGNIGFPSTEMGRAHFEHMLRSTSQELSDNDIQDLLGGLSVEEVQGRYAR